MLVLKKNGSESLHLEGERENFKTFSNLDWPELGGWECRLVVEGLPSILKA